MNNNHTQFVINIHHCQNKTLGRLIRSSTKEGLECEEIGPFFVGTSSQYP